jgi:hypothetical protein
VKSAVFWGIKRRRVVIVYRRFGTTYLTHLHGSRREDGTDILSLNVGKQLSHDAVIPQKTVDFINIAAEA